MKKIKKLRTPLGDVDIKIDGQSVPYDYKEMGPIGGRHFPLLGRCHIRIKYIPDGKEHQISCTINDERLGRGYHESGERLACISFYGDNRIKLSIGLEGETDYSNGKRYSAYDYDDVYLDNGLAFGIFPDTKTSEYLFAVAWIDDVGAHDPIIDGEDRDVETWFGADPLYD